jgi:sensor histidine kinase regulating citrate/malate metabolism
MVKQQFQLSLNMLKVVVLIILVVILTMMDRLQMTWFMCQQLQLQTMVFNPSEHFHQRHKRAAYDNFISQDKYS